MKKRRLILGCGYLGRRVAELLRARGDEVFAVTRSEKRAAELANAGLQPIIAEVCDFSTLSNLPIADSLLWAVGYDRRSDATLEDVYVEGFRNVMNTVNDAIERVVYISSTGVYGETDAEWVDEETSCQPNRPGAAACLAAEQLLGASLFAERSVILRLAGIYGPGRIPNRKSLVAGEPIAAPKEGHVNLIHVDDAAQVVLAAIDHPAPSRLYTVSDGHPPLRRHYYETAAKLLHAPPPRFATPHEDSHAAQRALVDKKVSNARMIAELVGHLRYPSHIEGLKAIFVENESH